jgi:hypothetical protein
MGWTSLRPRLPKISRGEVAAGRKASGSETPTTMKYTGPLAPCRYNFDVVEVCIH